MEKEIEKILINFRQLKDEDENWFTDLCELVWKKAHKELLEEIKQDYAEGNPAEYICMKYIDRLSKN